MWYSQQRVKGSQALDCRYGLACGCWSRHTTAESTCWKILQTERRITEPAYQNQHRCRFPSPWPLHIWDMAFRQNFPRTILDKVSMFQLFQSLSSWPVKWNKFLNTIDFLVLFVLYFYTWEWLVNWLKELAVKMLHCSNSLIRSTTMYA